jgi:hypothetical protein
MSTSDWYARRLATAQGHAAPPQAPPQYPQHPQQPQYPQQQQPQYPQQQQPQPINEQDFIKAGATRKEGITPMDVLERAGAKGGKGTRTETKLCPDCGGNQYFERKAAGKMGMAPAPYCHTCGYNGVFEQYGSQEVPLMPEEN